MDLERERRAAIVAVELASKLCLGVQTRFVGGVTLEKGDKSPVTIADFGAQAIVNHQIGLMFPHIPVIGEEDATVLRRAENKEMFRKVMTIVQEVVPTMTERTALDAIDRGTSSGGRPGRFWALDPIDGTKGFLRQEQYAVALALIEDGEVLMGVLGCPNLPMERVAGLGCLFVAVRGAGTRMIGMEGGREYAVKVDEVADPALARFCESVESGHTAQDDSARVAERLGITAPPVRMDSQCKYATVARGSASVYLRLPTRRDYVERVWDHAAGAIVVTEAGGKVTDVRGRALDFGCGRGLEENLGVVVTNGRLHDQVLQAVQASLG
jgi:3'(2'), 5'-bisphosphate nucleotidase